MSDNWLDEYKEGLFSGKIPMENPKIRKPGDPKYYYFDPRGMDKNAPLKDWKLIGVPTADTPNPALAETEKVLDKKKIVDLNKIPQPTYYDSYGRTSSKPVKIQDNIRLDPLDYPAIFKRNPQSWVLPKNLENVWSSPYHTQEEMEKAKQKLSKQLADEEEKKDFPYLDTRSNYTTGVGHMRKKSMTLPNIRG